MLLIGRQPIQAVLARDAVQRRSYPDAMKPRQVVANLARPEMIVLA
jgi:hypothetical protein